MMRLNVRVVKIVRTNVQWISKGEYNMLYESETKFCPNCHQRIPFLINKNNRIRRFFDWLEVWIFEDTNVLLSMGKFMFAALILFTLVFVPLAYIIDHRSQPTQKYTCQPIEK